jgi:predicted acylesterase/phospholipase RssA
MLKRDLINRRPSQPPLVVSREYRVENEHMGKKDVPKRVVIACQGGGTHTAFTAGVLKRLLALFVT